MNPLELRKLLATPYRLGGREIGRGIDCLGVVLLLSDWLGHPIPDPWPALRAAWRRGELDTCSGFPCGWRRVQPDQLLDGDVLLFQGVHPWAAIVVGGHVWSADADVGGVYCRSLAAWTKQPAEVWRHDDAQAVGAPGPAG